MKIKEWNEREKTEPNDALRGRQIVDIQLPRDPQGRCRCQNRKQIIGPVVDGKPGKPCAHDNCRKRWMFGKAERKVSRPCDQFGHIGMKILTAFCDDAIKGPCKEIAGQNGKYCSISLFRTL